MIDRGSKGFLMKVYAGYNCDLSVRKNTSSGGIYPLLAKRIINSGGVVFAAVYDEHLNVIHKEIANFEDLQESFGSKYVFSNFGTCIHRIFELLKKGIVVLFVGTPCQCASIKKSIGDTYKNLICIDLVCHGSPKPEYWQKYLKSLKNKNGITPKKVNMRDKSSGWSYINYCWCIEDYNGKKYYQRWRDNIYMRGFIADLLLIPGCYRCKYKKENHLSDITLGDYWGVWKLDPDMDDNNGTSLIMIHSDIGLALFNEICTNIKYKIINNDNYLFYNRSILNCADKPLYYEEFQQRVKGGEDIQKLIVEYLGIDNNRGWSKGFIRFFPLIVSTKMKSVIKHILNR